MFVKEVSYAHQGCIYLIKNKVKQQYCEILLQFKKTASRLILFLKYIKIIIFKIFYKLNINYT